MAADRSAFGTGDIHNYLSSQLSRANVSDYFLGLSTPCERAFFTPQGLLEEGRAASALVSPWELGCLLKPFIAMAALELVSQGLMRIQDTIEKYLSNFVDSPKGETLQVQHLLSSTTGYVGFMHMPPVHLFPNRQRGMRRVGEAESLFWPGAVFNYENSGTALLGEILKTATGFTPIDLINQKLVAACGFRLASRGQMNQSDSPVEANAADLGSKSLLGHTLTATKLFAAIELLAGTNSSGEQPSAISCSSRQALTRRIVSIPRAPNSGAARLLPWGSTLGLFEYKDGYFGYDGKTKHQTIAFRFNPASRVVLVIALGTGDAMLKRKIMNALIDRLSGRLMESRNVVPIVGIGTDGFGIHDIVGDYVGDHSFHISVRRLNNTQAAVIARSAHGSRLLQQGAISPEGRVAFATSNAGIEPNWFRYDRTGEVCMMLGMCALKKVPLAVIRTSGAIPHE